MKRRHLIVLYALVGAVVAGFCYLQLRTFRKKRPASPDLPRVEAPAAAPAVSQPAFKVPTNLTAPRAADSNAPPPPP
jgi:hypothetical protein